MRLTIILCLCAASSLGCGGAAAQDASPPSSDGTAPQTDVQGDGSLSDKLSNTGGVIHPQTDVDPGIRKAAPNAGASAMPVIPPTGTPGDPAGAQPK